MRKKKKIKRTLSNLKEKKSLPFKVAYPLGKSKDDKPFMVKIGGVWLDPVKMLKGLDVVHKEICPGKAGAARVVKALESSAQGMNWITFIILAETVGLTPDKLYKNAINYFQEERTSKLKVAMMTPAMVHQLLKRINKWGGVYKTWNTHKKYIDEWCKLTQTPLIESFGAFKNYVTDWKKIMNINRFKSKNYQSSKIAEYTARAEKKLKEKGYSGKS